MPTNTRTPAGTLGRICRKVRCILVGIESFGIKSAIFAPKGRQKVAIEKAEADLDRYSRALEALQEARTALVMASSIYAQPNVLRASNQVSTAIEIVQRRQKRVVREAKAGIRRQQV